MFIGGAKAPFDAFHYPADPVTAHVNANLILNFCYDVAGYGALGLVARLAGVGCGQTLLETRAWVTLTLFRQKALQRELQRRLKTNERQR